MTDMPATARILDGKGIAEDLLDNLKARVAARVADGRKPPGLAVVLVGSDPASSAVVAYDRNLDITDRVVAKLKAMGPPKAGLLKRKPN